MDRKSETSGFIFSRIINFRNILQKGESLMEKTIKYLENGEYHYATVRSVGDLAQLKTNSKETLVEAINELWNGGGNADPSKAPKPEGYDQLVQDVADAVKNQQEINQQWTEWQKEDAQLTEERKQAYLQAMKEMQESVDKAKADAAALDKKLQEGVDTLNNKTSKLDEEITKTFSDLDTSIQNMHEQLQREADSMNQELINTKSDLTKVRTDLQNAQLDNGRIHDELTNINGKFEHKVWQTDLDPLKEQIDRAETSVQQTKDELLGKASRQDLDTVTNTVSKLDTQLKETAKGVEISVKKDELGGDVARLLNDKTNLLLGTRNFSGEDNWKNRDAVTIEPGYYKGLKSVAVQVTDRSIYQPYHVKANTAYTFSFFGKEDKDNSKATLIIKPIDAPNINIDNAEQPVHITTEWQRFAVTFSADQDCDISIQIIQGPEASNNILHLAGFKLQYGQNNTPWEPNEADVAENIEHTESQFNVYSDQIAGIVKKQEKMGDTERQLDTRITETAEGLKQTSKDLQDANGKITEFKGRLESTARGLKTEYEKYTNDAVGQISDSTLNLIRNSSFQNKDEDFAQWQNVSAKANVRQDENGLRWVELTQSGMTTDNPQGLTSNYFNVKQGKVTVAVDIKAGDKATLDNESVLFLELYNDAKKRVDFRFVTLSELGLSKNLLDDHKVHRGLYRLGIDRNDTKYMTVKAHLMRNGDLYFTNFSARLSSIDDGAYEPNPDDVNHQILKQNTKIEQNAKEVAIKANSVDVTRDIKSAVDGIKVGGTNLAAGTNQEYTMGYGIPNTIWKDGNAYATLPTTGSGNEILPQDPHMFWYTLTAGQEYTQTIWFRTDAIAKDLKASGITWFTSDGHDYQPATIQKIGPNSYKLFCSYKWPGKNNNDVRLFDISELRQAFDLNTGTYLKFGKLKLEEGNKSTSWSPAPEDTSAEIKSAKDAAIQVASDQINLHVNELTTSFDDKLNTRVNEAKTASEKFTSDGIEQTVTKITNVKNDVDRLGDKVDGIQVGGTNLLKNSAGPFQPKSDGRIDNYQWFNSVTINMIQGHQYTVSGVTNGIFSDYHDTSTESDRCVLWLCHYDRGVSQIISSNTTGHGTTFIWNHPTDTYTLRVNTYHPASTNKIKAWNIKIESGNKKTDWAPAPEDTSEEIKSAKEAAIKVSSDKIDLQVQEITGKFNDKLNKSAVEIKSASEKFTTDGIEQTVTKITNVKNDVDRLGDKVNSVGSRNLLHNTSDRYKTLTGNGYLAQSTASDIYTSTANYHNGDWFTYAATITNNSSKNVTLETWLFDQNKQELDANSIAPIPLATHSADVYPGEKDKRVSTSFQISGATWFIRTYVIFDGGGAPNGSQVQVKDERLVEGRLDGSWSPNPDDINRKIDTQTIDSANIDQMKTQGHYFVRNLTGNPIGGWVYVDVTGNNNDRVRQDVYADQNNQHKYRSWNGSRWSDWEQGAYLSDVKTEVTASVKNLGDRVTTEVNSITTRQNNFENETKAQHSNDVELVRKSDFEDGSKGNWTVTGVVPATNPAPPAELGQSGMKVLQTNTRDGYEDGIWYSVKPGEKFDVDFWCAPSSAFHTTFGLCFVDKNKGNWNWQGIQTDQSGQWKHYTGTITAPANASFARPWYQMDKPANNTENSSWIAKPHIRRQNPQVAEKISELNTKWDVANGQIQGKVTATDVNNIINGKGYATQSWAQTMFQMKSDSITLQAVRDNITNGIQNQVNDTNSRLANTNSELNNTKDKLNNIQVGERNLAVGTNRGKAGWWVDPGNGTVTTDVCTLNGARGLHINNTKKSTSWWVVCYPFDMGKLKPNTYYTISFDLQTSENINGGAIIDLARGDSSGSPFIEGRGSNFTTNGGEITHVTRTLKTGGSIENNGQALYINSIALGGSNVVNIANLMIVEGTQSSVWKPAPEDQGSGQNLLRGTADFSWPTGIGMNNSFEFNYERFDDSTIAMHLWNIKDNGAGIYTKWGGAFPDGQIQVGEQYTFSFDVKGSGKFLTVRNESEPEKGMLTLSGVNIPSEWARVSVTGTIQALDKAFIIYLAQGANVWIKNVQIERGAIATPWTPHPFDDKDKGVNLLKSTAYWNPADWNHISDNVWYDDNWLDNLGHKAYGHHTAWQGLGQTVYVTPGVYTWSAQIYVDNFDDSDFVQVYLGDNQYNGTVQTSNIRVPQLRKGDSDKWVNYSATFYVKNAGNLCVRPELNRDHGEIHVGSQKLEHGMIATPWTPSPHDDKNATITLDSANIDDLKTQGHYFVRNLTGNPIGGWVYVDVTGNNNDRLKQEVYQDNGYEHRSRRWTGSGWTEWTTDVNNKNVVSQINITPDQIKIASNKIVIDGNTDIHGDLRTDRVRLVGKNGAIDMTGDTGIKLTNNDGSSMLLERGNIDLMYKNDFRMNIDSSLMTIMQRNQFTNQNKPIAILNIGSSWNHSNNKVRGADIRYNPGNVNDEQSHGADYLSLSYNKPNLSATEANIHPQITLAYQDLKFDENHYLWRKGVNVADDLTIQEYQRINVGYRDKEDQSGKWTNDPLMIHRMQWGTSSQADRYQPTIRLGYNKDTMGSAGVTFLWNQVKPFGNRDISDLGDIWFNGQRFVFGWASHANMFGNQQQPAFMRLDDKGGIMSGIAFTPGSTWDLGSGAWNISLAMMALKDRGII